MLNLFKTIAKTGKDLVLAELARFLLNKFGLEPYGEFSNLTIDTQEKQIAFALMLNGEEQPVSGTIHYHLESVGPELLMIADSVKLSREWMNVLFDRHFTSDQRRFVIPSQLKSVVKMAGL